MARIFISHSSQNNAEALALRDWLVSQGWSDLFLDIDPVDGLVAAQRWQVALRQSIGHCRAVIFCISPEWRTSEYCLSEFNEAMHAGATPVGVVINPIELDRIPAEMTKHWQVVDLTRGGTMLSFVVAPPPKRVPVVVRFPEEELQRLRSGLAKLGLVGFETSSFPWPPANEPNRAPYRGLEPLDAQDAGVFFGRDSDLVRAREELLVLRQQGGRRVFAILGASGAGKSSFLRAGILPRLDRESRDYFVLPIIRPADAAITGRHGLAASLEQAFAMVNARHSMGELKQALADHDSMPLLLTKLHRHVTSRFTGDAEPQIDRPVTLVLTIDQTEELFSTSNSTESNSFLRHLQAAVSNGPEVLALITIRSDRFSILQDSALLKEIPAHLFNLPPVKPAAFREAIVGPAMRVAPPVVLDKRLVEQLTTDSVAQGADPLPLLAFTLERLYLDYGRSTGRLTLENYASSGGLTGAIDAVLAEAFGNPERYPPIPREERDRESLIDAAFVPALVDINEANDEPLRRIAKEGEIPNAARGLLDRLVEKRLLVRSSRPRSDATGTETTIEVAHEAILRHWQTLRRILDRKSTELRAIQATEQAATVWQRQDHKAEWLDHKGERLLIAESLARNPAYLARFSGLPAEYLQECRKAQDRAEQDREAQLKARERAQKRAQLFLLGLIALAVALLLGAGWQTRQAARREARVFDSLATKAISANGRCGLACKACPRLARRRWSNGRDNWRPRWREARG
jgi:hypothetical protein